MKSLKCKFSTCWENVVDSLFGDKNEWRGPWSRPVSACGFALTCLFLFLFLASSQGCSRGQFLKEAGIYPVYPSGRCLKFIYVEFDLNRGQGRKSRWYLPARERLPAQEEPSFLQLPTPNLHAATIFNGVWIWILGTSEAVWIKEGCSIWELLFCQGPGGMR